MRPTMFRREQAQVDQFACIIRAKSLFKRRHAERVHSWMTIDDDYDDDVPVRVNKMQQIRDLTLKAASHAE